MILEKCPNEDSPRLSFLVCTHLIAKGGVSTDVFKKALGEETTKDFFDKVFFGTETQKKQ